MANDNQSTIKPRLRDLSSEQWRSGIAAWLGWLFDGLDMHLYTMVAAPFVAHLLGNIDQKDPSVPWHSSIIQAGFLVGWALGGGFFGVIGDRIGRSRALSLTIITYAAFTGLSFFAQTWWHLLIFRFVAALGIGGEWAIGASLLSETWPKQWRHWIAAVLQTGVNLGVLVATVAAFFLAGREPRFIFLVGVMPAFMVFWIRKKVPEPAEWRQAMSERQGDVDPNAPGVQRASIGALFQPGIRRTTWLCIAVCATSLTSHWAFMFWYQQHLRHLPEVESWSAGDVDRLVSRALALVMCSSIAGNFIAAILAKSFGYPRAIGMLCLTYGTAMLIAYWSPRTHDELYGWLILMGMCQGVFALFTMYLPPLFPTLLRTTGAGFCYNIGRIAAAAGTIFFGLFQQVGDYRRTLFLAAFLFFPAVVVTFFLPRQADDLD